MAVRLADCVQRGHYFCIVDEVDSILIDEARTPLIISGGARGGDRHLLPLRADRPDPQEGRGLRRRREAPRRVAHRERRRQGREGARHREPLPRRQRQPGQPPDPGAQGARPLPQGQGVHRPRRRAADRRRVHRPGARGAALLEGLHQALEAKEGAADPRGEPDPRDDHAPELLPHVREALGHDGHGRDRGQRVREDLQRRGHVDPDPHAHDPGRRERLHLQDQGREVPRRRSRRSSRRTSAASRCWSGRSRSRSPRCSRGCSPGAGSSTTC